MKVPVGKLRLIQVFLARNILCSCGSAHGAMALWCDDEHDAFYLAQTCADEMGLLDEWKIWAEKLKALQIGESFRIELPPWKEGSEHQWHDDIPELLGRLGANVHHICRTGCNEIIFSIPAPISGQAQRNPAT